MFSIKSHFFSSDKSYCTIILEHYIYFNYLYVYFIVLWNFHVQNKRLELYFVYIIKIICRSSELYC